MRICFGKLCIWVFIIDPFDLVERLINSLFNELFVRFCKKSNHNKPFFSLAGSLKHSNLETELRIGPENKIPNCVPDDQFGAMRNPKYMLNVANGAKNCREASSYKRIE